MAGLMRNPQELNFWGRLQQKNMSGLMDRYQKQQAQQRLIAGQQQAKDLIGTRQTPYQMSEEELFPGESQTTAAPGLMNKGTGYIGTINPERSPEKLAQAELYGGLLSTPGYQQIGAQGMQGMISQQGLMNRQLRSGESEIGSENFNRSEKLRKSFEGQTKDFVKVRDAYRRIEAAAKKPTAAGDMALIFNFMKVLDPGSTVREGEFATAQNATGVPSRVMNMYNNIISGERLNPVQRKDFVGQANNLYTAQLGGLEQLENQYTGLAQSFGLNPKNVIIDYRVKSKKQQAAPPPPQGFK